MPTQFSPMANNARSGSVGILDYLGGRQAQEVVADDRKRDWRNAERRHIIKEQTSQRRGSLIDSLLIAKDILSSQTRNKEYERKASERRHKIQQYNNFLDGELSKNNRRLSFADEVNNACFMIAPRSVSNASEEKPKKTRRKIRKEISTKRRPSFLDQIQVAQSAIMDQNYRANEGMIGSDLSHYYSMDYSKPAESCVLEMGH
ncbi:PREDICTED: uncharacterized protein LOC107356321 [Acropora digitifera]|uniref:uncharacterized protein LOC107356321 n=1 Tax=Acropora digitifera TaxID=70779 RepID=UPI00077AB433|nr:PREDICTED: uncharacterized protein LOC107356321 [Acropora digitifera]